MPQQYAFTIKYLLLGIIMSTVSTRLFETTGLPTMPELIYFPVLYFWKKDFTFEKNWKNGVTLWVLIWAVFLCIAVINDRFSLGAIVTTGRAYLYMGIFAVWAACLKCDRKFYKALFYVSVGSLLGWCLVIILIRLGFLPKASNGITYGNMVSIPLCISMVFALYPTLWWTFVAIATNIFLSFTTSLRRQITVSFLSLAISYLLTLQNKRAYKIHLPIIFAIVLVFVNLPRIENYVREYDYYTYQRIFERSKNFSGKRTDHGDQTRVNNYKKLYENIDDYYVPHGYVSKRTSVDHEVGAFVDCPVLEVVYTFGILPSILGFIWFLYRILSYLCLLYRSGNPEYMIWVTSGALCIVLLFVESTFLSYTYTVPQTGIIIGMLSRHRLENYEQE